MHQVNAWQRDLIIFIKFSFDANERTFSSIRVVSLLWVFSNRISFVCFVIKIFMKENLQRSVSLFVYNILLMTMLPVGVFVCNGIEHWTNGMFFLYHLIIKLQVPLTKCTAEKKGRFDTDYWYPLFHLSIYLHLQKCYLKKKRQPHRPLSFSMQTLIATKYAMVLVK